MSDREEGSLQGSDTNPEKSERSNSASLSPPRRSRTRSHSRSRSVSPRNYRRHKRSYYSRSRSRSHHRYSRSRSRSPGRRKHGEKSGRSYRGHRRSHSRSPMSSRRRHVGNRDDPEPTRCLGVFGLSLHTQDRELRDVFARYGSIDECNIVYDRQSGRSRGFAFVYFRNVDDAVEAKDRCNGLEIDGRRIRVDYSITERAHTPTPGIYLGKPTTSKRSYRSPSPPHYRRRSPSPYYRRRSRTRSRSRSYSPHNQLPGRS